MKNFDYRPITADCEEKQQCQVDGLDVCMHPETICDLHPTCDGGKDELDCEESYKEKRYFDGTKTFRCTSPMYSGSGKDKDKGKVTILATPCDGRSECWEDADESACGGLSDGESLLFLCE